MSLYNNISQGIQEQAAIAASGQSLFDGIGASISGMFGDGAFGQALGAIGSNYAQNAVQNASNLISPQLAGGIGLGVGGLGDVLNGDYNNLGVRLLNSGLVDKFIPGIHGILAQARYWRTPTPLYGGISPYDARNIHREMRSIPLCKKNLFLVEVSSLLFGDVSKRFNMFTTEMEYSPQTLSGDKHKVGGATVDSITGSEPVELRITTLDDKAGFIKSWFKTHAYMAVGSDGTMNAPAYYAIKIKIVHGFITQASNDNGYQDIGWFRPGNIDISLSRRDDGLEELQMTFSQLDTFIQAS